VRITLDIDDDVASCLCAENRRTSESMQETIHRILRAGFLQDPSPAPCKRFIVKPIQGLQFPPEWTSGCVQELIAIVEGTGTRE
jgi:hypothetical protein